MPAIVTSYLVFSSNVGATYGRAYIWPTTIAAVITRKMSYLLLIIPSTMNMRVTKTIDSAAITSFFLCTDLLSVAWNS